MSDTDRNFDSECDAHDIDDTVKACPECDTPNQFGEICPRCQREFDREIEAEYQAERKLGA